MSGRRIVFALCAITLLWASQAMAQAPKRLALGAIVWTADTDLSVDSATNWDGTSRTAEESARSWNAIGSGMGARLGYEFPRLLSIYGEAGMAQTTVRNRDLSDLDVSSRGLDAGAFFGAGLRVGADIPQSRLFWSAGVGMRRLSANLEEDPAHRWAYDETDISGDGRLGTRLHLIGLYGGLRLAQQSSRLQQTDLTRTIGEQTRRTDLNRDRSFDLLVGAQTGSDIYSGFAELGVLGTVSATAGVSVRF